MMSGGTNAKLRADVEGIVRQVLAEISGRPQPRPENHGLGELVLLGKVISLAAVEDRLNGVARVVVERGAIFTPAARDELKKHKVAIASAVARTAGSVQRVVLGVTESDFDIGPLAAALSQHGVQTERLAPGGLVDVTHKLCEHVTGGDRRGLLITNQPAAAVCLANRRCGVRAALAYNSATAADAASTIAANLLVVDPRGKSVFEMNSIARKFASGGQSGLPAGLARLLD